MSLDLPEILAEMPLAQGVYILGTHPQGLVALHKPCRVLSHPNQKEEKRRSLLDAEWSSDRERYSWNSQDRALRFYLLHRLDSATSGVILGCVNPNLAQELKSQFSRRKVSKRYQAVVFGKADKLEPTWRDLLQKRASRGGVRMEPHNRGVLAQTKAKCLESRKQYPAMSLLDLHPITGRTHQLRVQAALRKLPIVGDATYGNFKLNRLVEKALGSERLFLHAASIHIHWENGG
ncbi:MAG: RNA pseudouridine synthase, partial [Verrucomicrobiae bacterium]|nr:RNA pseudouridine synthase [Verrucomicrobiae bacterium]